jgi:hypothetical protein
MKLTFLAAILCFGSQLFAGSNLQNSFQFNSKRTQAFKESELEKITKKFKNFEQVPTMVKNYGWSDSLMNWEGESREEYTYANNKVVSLYTYDINRTDTLSRLTLTYDADNYLLFYYLELYLGNGEYQPQIRIYYEYENNYQKMTVTNEFFNFITNVWIPNARFSEEKINNGQTSRITNYSYLPGGWSEASGYSYTIKRLNNTSSKVSEFIDSLLNTNTGLYEFYSKEARVYDANENAIAIVFSENVNGTIKTTEIDSIYYVNNVPIELVIAVVDFSIPKKIYKYGNLVWQNYDSNKDINENISTDYVGYVYATGTWRFSDRMSTSFIDGFGSNVELNEEYKSNNWTAVDRSTERFNARGYKILDKYERYDATTSEWNINNADSSTLVYDSNNNIIELAKVRYNSLLNFWENTEKQEYFDFITISTGLNTSKNTLEVKLFPNPSADGKVSVNINMEAASELSIKITDLKGSVVYIDVRNLGKGLNTVELSGLQQGMYVVEMSSEYGVARTKLAVN